MFVFNNDLHIIQLLVPSICSGILFLGLLLFMYVFVNTKSKLHFSMFVMALCAFLFVTSELSILIWGGIYKNSDIGRELHRIEQLSGTLFLFAIPYLVSHILKLNKSWKKVNMYVSFAGFSAFCFVAYIAFVFPDYFISQNLQRPTALLFAWDYGRGLEGEVYRLRNLFFMLLTVYTVICFIYDLYKNKKHRTLLLPLIGILLAALGAVDDTVSIYSTNRFNDPPYMFFSRFSLGVTVFVITAMTVILHDYLEQGNRLSKAFLDLESAYRSLNNSETRFKQIAENINEVFIIYDFRNDITIYVSPGFKKMFGIDVEKLYETPRNLFDFLLPDDAEKLKSALKPENIKDTIEINFRIKRQDDGSVRWIGSHIYAVHDKNGGINRLILILDDITDRKHSEEELTYIAYHDVLTGLQNRRAFFERFYELIMQANREQPKNKKALFYIDLDRLKNINDLMGHSVGDRVLELFPKRLQKCLRKSDYSFRIGGDEFTVILNGIVNDLDAAHVAEKIIEEMSAPYEINGREVFQSISIGISLYPDDADEAGILIKSADVALNEAKKLDESYVFFNENMNQDAFERITIENNFMGAIEQGQFELYYQPLIGQGNKIIGMESLLRWNHPELGFVTPDTFIPIAESTGFILTLGEWAIDLACKQMQAWYEQGYQDIWMSVNLSALQFRDDNLVPMIKDLLDKYQLQSNNLKFEITESSIMERADLAEKKINQLHEIGIDFCIDDFGTGYSSLSYLNKFNITHLKVDRSFIADIIENQSNQEITKAIIAMAHNLKLDVVAEGVETKEQADFLRSLGCDALQGFLFSKPVPADSFSKLLEKGIKID